jgi:hypothetical protein
MDLSNLLSNILAKRNTTYVLGANTNSSIGTRASPCEPISHPDNMKAT